MVTIINAGELVNICSTDKIYVPVKGVRQGQRKIKSTPYIQGRRQYFGSGKERLVKSLGNISLEKFFGIFI